LVVDLFGEVAGLGEGDFDWKRFQQS
jgi:hypothetical protein